MDGEVAELRREEAAEEGVDLERGGAGVERVVQVVPDVGREAPVVAAVLEEVPDGHGGVAEPVHEHGLQQPLGVVQHPAPRRDVGRGAERRRGGRVQVPVSEPGPGVEPEVDQQRPRVLEHEHRAPPDLQPSVLNTVCTMYIVFIALQLLKGSHLEIDNGFILNSKLLQCELIFQWFPLWLKSQLLSVYVLVL